MGPFLYHCAVAVGGVLGLMALWFGVQRAWGRFFRVGGDVLAARRACDGCARAGRCAYADPRGANEATASDLEAVSTPDEAG